jgi:hypothetical protein
MKQTAVEWLANEIQEQLNFFFPGATLYQPTIEQAKEMEKEQINNAHYEGSENYRRQYYNETFKKNKMEKIPTAEELYLKTLFPTSFENKRDEVELCFETDGHAKEHIEVMIGFAKMHVTAALKQAAHESQCYNKAKFPGDENWVVDIDSILDSYPLENIK